MTLDPETRAAVIDRCAHLLKDQAQENLGSLDDLIVIDLSTVAQMLGCSRKWASQMLPVTQLSDRIAGVRLSALRKHLDDRTSAPGEPRKLPAHASA